MVNLIGYARYGSPNLSSDGGSKLGFGPPSLPTHRVESSCQRRFIGCWLCASLAKEKGVSMSDEDDLYKYYDRMDERRRGEEEQYSQANRAELNAAWLRGVESRDYSEFQNKLGLGLLTGPNLGGKSPAATHNPIGDRDWRQEAQDGAYEAREQVLSEINHLSNLDYLPSPEERRYMGHLYSVILWLDLESEQSINLLGEHMGYCESRNLFSALRDGLRLLRQAIMFLQIIKTQEKRSRA
jgi:hypothetical protein